MRLVSMLRFGLGLTMALILAGCLATPLPPVQVQLLPRTIDYQREVKPLLDRRCTVCHSCYNSPCQLKLDSFEGIDRGSSKEAIYNSSRLRTMEPTRLFTDAQTTTQWRAKGFSSVTASTVSGNLNDSLMIQMLAHKIKHPKSSGEYRPEAEDLTCAKDQDELGSYLAKHPNRGMPFGFPPLKQDEFNLIANWLVQGAKGPDPGQQAHLTAPAPADIPAIARWEAFLNQDDAKHGMTARYLYEHLFLAHLTFASGSNQFYELVRSRTAPGQPIDLIPTVRPYDDPGATRVYYRFRKIHSTIVHKTHMVFTLDDAQFKRLQELFITPDWLQVPHLVGYDPQLSANPFRAFEQIPPRSRYQFLLDNAQYIIMTFIHGPVCKGQIALNVIDDHFWVMFVDPSHDLAVNYPGFLKLHADKLRMPIEQGSDMGFLPALTNRYSEGARAYYQARQDYYTSHFYAGLGPEAIWKGNRANDAPLLTVYRHFDNASVHKGALGNLPKSLWVLDYPLLERIYYSLVAGFDVYGNIAHQLALRLYMDTLRIEGESYFLDFMPAAKRQEIMQSWYLGIDLSKLPYYPSALPAKFPFQSDDPKREFVEQLIDHELLTAAGIHFDPINYLRAGAHYPRLPDNYRSSDDYLKAFRALSRPGMPFVALINDYNANLAYLRIRQPDGNDRVVSLVVNRWHDNVAFLFGEDGRLNPARDEVDFIPGLIGSYPNYFFDVTAAELPDFFNLLNRFNGSPQDLARLSRYGINRADDRFWGVYDWFQQRLNRDEPLYGGLLDLNRYYYEAH